MQIDIKIREDLWKAIEAHYERKDFTEAVRDAVFHMSEVLREKGCVEDKDGAKLVDVALLGNNPAILVNKNETTTEKDFQQGIGFAFKGIMKSVRNPLSHESFKYTQDEAETLILYINFLLNQVDKSGGSTKIDNIIDLLLDDDFTDTQEYAELLLKEVPIKNRYCDTPLYDRTEDVFPNQMLKYCEARGHALITTTQLLCLYIEIKRNPDCDEERISELLTCIGKYKRYLDYENYLTFSGIEEQ